MNNLNNVGYRNLLISDQKISPTLNKCHTCDQTGGIGHRFDILVGGIHGLNLKGIVAVWNRISVLIDAIPGNGLPAGIHGTLLDGFYEFSVTVIDVDHHAAGVATQFKATRFSLTVRYPDLITQGNDLFADK